MAKQKPKAKRRTARSGVLAPEHFPDHDARTLAEASAIKADKGRFSKAQKASVKLIKEQQAQVEGLKKVLKGL